MQRKLKKSLSVLLSLLMALSLLGGLAVSAGAEDGQQILTVIADAKMKDRGQADPPLTYRVEGLAPGDSVFVELERQPGESGGYYAISAKRIEASGNYVINYVGADFIIRTHGPHCVCYKTVDDSVLSNMIRFACVIVTSVIRGYEAIIDSWFS